MNPEQAKQNQYTAPVSIIIAGFIIAAAIIYSGPQGSSNLPNLVANDSGVAEHNTAGAVGSFRPVDERDYIRGNPDAAVTIIEYSDFECPFCSRLHPILKQAVSQYDGDVRWVYRHFPLTSIHSRALAASVAAECAGELGGNGVFWEFTDGLFDNQHSLGEELYLRLAGELGLNEPKFSACLSDERHNDKISSDGQNAVVSGGRGTPYSIVVSQSGKATSFSGALPYENIEQFINDALNDT